MLPLSEKFFSFKNEKKIWCAEAMALWLPLSICCHIAQAVKAFVFELCDLFSFIWTNDKNSCTPTFVLNLAELTKIICEWAKLTHTCYIIIFHIFHFHFNIFNSYYKFSYRSLYFDSYEKKTVIRSNHVIYHVQAIQISTSYIWK